METLQIRDIKDNQTVDGTYLVREMTRGETRTGNPFLSLTVMDSSGEIGGRVWENAERLAEQCPAGSFIRLKALAQSYKGTLQLRIDHLEQIEVPEKELGRFLPSTPGDIDVMGAELIRLAKGIEDQDYRNLAMAFLGDSKILKSLKKAPAAKAMHHAYFGGLLEHTLGVARLAKNVAELYPAIDRSLLLTGAILHDIGKLIEFSYDTFPYDYSDQGRLVGHMVLGIEMLQEKGRALPHFPGEKMTHLKHLILSHHGRHEFGSPSLPMMLEAFVLNFLDDLDAKINYIRDLGRKTGGEGYRWTDYQRNLERFLYVQGEQNDDVDNGNGRQNQAENEIDPRQRNLWLK
ncbi:MAG: HD domain-containing protein [Proteobacteria bacterium]|nr:HD domain-containing protein [Pseudomonadota bacterium]MBU1738805.1 HD domain-containing protein [Pseudomonadota bacterium]